MMSKINNNENSINIRHFSPKIKRNRKAVKLAFSNITPKEYDYIVRKASLGMGYAL